MKRNWIVYTDSDTYGYRVEARCSTRENAVRWCIKHGGYKPINAHEDADYLIYKKEGN